MPATQHVPLNDADLAALDDFLLANEDKDCLPIDEAHGYLCAQLVANLETADAEWLESIFGDTDFDNSDEKNRYFELLTRMASDIKTTLDNKQVFEPLIIEEEDENGESYENYEGWCFGFMLGVTSNSDSWDTLPNEKEDLLTPIAQLALLHSGEELDIDDEEYAMCIELLPGAVAGLYNHWHNH